MADPATTETADDGEDRFIGRVLLALDGHLDAGGLAALKAELAEDVAKRRLFVQLCLQSRALAEVHHLHREGAEADDRAFLAAIELRLGHEWAAGEAADRARPRRRPAPAPPPVAALDDRRGGLGRRGAVDRLRPREAPGDRAPRARDRDRGRDGADGARGRGRRAVTTADAVAMVIKLDGVQWERADEAHPAEGDLLPPGRLRLRSGRATLTMLSGVVLIAEGPADVDLIAIDRVFCRQGKLRSRVPKGAEGFVIASPSSSVLDLGTEFGLNVDLGGKSRVTVFDGKAEAVVRTETEDGEQVRDQIIERSKVFELDPNAGQIEAVDESEGFIAPNGPGHAVPGARPVVSGLGPGVAPLGLLAIRDLARRHGPERGPRPGLFARHRPDPPHRPRGRQPQRRVPGRREGPISDDGGILGAVVPPRICGRGSGSSRRRSTTPRSSA